MRLDKSFLIFILGLTITLDIFFVVLTLTGAGIIIELLCTALTWLLIIAIFKFKGVNLISIKKVKGIKSKATKGGNKWGKIASVVGEFIPFVDIFIPGFTLFAYYTYKETVEEDLEKIKKQNNAAAASRIYRRGSAPGSTGDRIKQRGTRTAEISQGPNEIREKGLKRSPKRVEPKFDVPRAA